MRKIMDKVLSFLLIGIIIFQVIPTPTVLATERANSFIKFYAESNGAILDNSNLTNQDYFVLQVYMSNWFRPGQTTLKDLVECELETSFFKSFTTYLNLADGDSGNSQLQKIVQNFGKDIFAGIQSGECTIVDESNNTLDGKNFLYKMTDSLGDLGKTNGVLNYNDFSSKFAGMKKSEVYFKNNKNIAFDFSSLAVKAAFQTAMAYSPDLFLSNFGVYDFKYLFIDATGNLWGCTSGAVNPDYENTEYDKGKNILSSGGIDKVYLILPACLNPSTFSNGAKTQQELRMPLINRFVLSSMVYRDDMENTEHVSKFTDGYVPIYNVLSYTSSTVKNSALNVIGIHSLSPYTLNTSYIEEKNSNWSKEDRNESLANFIYNPNAFVVGENNNLGQSKFKTNSYIVFAPNMYNIKTDNGEIGKTGNIDMTESVFAYNTNIAFNVFYAGDSENKDNSDGDIDEVIHEQKKLLLYLFSPTALSLNQVSMNLYKIENNGGGRIESGTGMDGMSKSITKEISGLDGDGETAVNDGALAPTELSKLGISSLNLFLEDVEWTFTDEEKNDKYYSVTAANMVNSKFITQLTDFVNANGSVQIDNHDYSLAKSVSEGTTTSSKALEFFFRGTSGVSNPLHIGKVLDNIVEDNGAKLKDTMSVMGLGDNAKNNTTTIYKSLNSSYGEGETPYDTMYFGTKSEYSEANETTTYQSGLLVMPSVDSIVNVGNNNNDVTIGRLISLNDRKIGKAIASTTNSNEKDTKGETLSIDGKLRVEISVPNFDEYMIALYGYSVFFPSNGLKPTSRESDSNLWVGWRKEGASKAPYNTSSGIKMSNLPDKIMMGVYLGYMVDMMGLGTCVEGMSPSFGSFSSIFLPRYDISAGGGNMTIDSMLGNTGVNKTEDLSFEEMQKDLIKRVYGITNDSDNSYRNSLIKNILEGFILTIHRTITGTWGSAASSISTGNSSTYQSVTGYVYTPTLEELSFTATIMNNYIKLYMCLLAFVLFLLILMVLLHMRTWQQGMLTFLVMCVALLFPYVLVSNSINISNSISDNIYSDRFDFWAMSEHFQSVVSLQGSDFMSEKDKWLAEASATTDTTKYNNPGVKIRWMSPKKVDMFQNLYSDASLSQSFVTNIEIFKWLFASTIYDSEFVDTDVYGSFVYRSYNNIALEAQSYYSWGISLENTTLNPVLTDGVVTYNGNSYQAISGLNTLIGDGAILADKAKYFKAGIGMLDDNFYTTNNGSNLKYSPEKMSDINKVSQFIESGKEQQARKGDYIGAWGMFGSNVNTALVDTAATTNVVNPGIFSNLPTESYTTDTFTQSTDSSLISQAIYLKNTESPFYYFYSVLKRKYGETSGTKTSFKNALLKPEVFKITPDVTFDSTSKKVTGAYRDFLGMEGLFTYVIPYLNLGNEYVEAWQEVNGTEIEEFNFEYEVDESGNVDEGSIGQRDGESVITGDNNDLTAYKDAVTRKNAMNRVWNMYSPWVESLYDLDVMNTKVTMGTKRKYIENSLNPSCYIEQGRPMIFSEADMIVKGYNYGQLTDVEKRIQAVTEKTYTDLLYLVNYYDMDDEVLLCAAAMYATFNFNREFSQDNFIGKSVMLYPQGFELKNFNYDAFMRLALLNSTGETVFATDDLYTRILSKTSIFTGLMLLVCDLVACVAIPVIKFVILIGILFLGLLICITCVVNPPEKIFENVNKTLLLPTALFMALNIAFSFAMSIVIGEGLTSYVGSRSVALSTNDPGMTMIVMAGIGIVYILASCKILKMIFVAFKKYGMSTLFATAGILGSAGSLAFKKMRSLADKTFGAGLGLATGGVSGAIQGASGGTGRLIKQRADDRRYRKRMQKINEKSNKDLAEKLNKMSGSAGDGKTELPKKSSSSSSSTNSDSSSKSSTEATNNSSGDSKAAENKKKTQEQLANVEKENNENKKNGKKPKVGEMNPNTSLKKRRNMKRQQHQVNKSKAGNKPKKNKNKNKNKNKKKNNGNKHKGKNNKNKGKQKKK